MKQPTFSDVSNLAYRLYLEDGKPEGEAESHWHRALEILLHPENRSDSNVLSPPSEPELTRSLDARAEILDGDLPSNPASGEGAWRQHVALALGEGSPTADRVREMLRDFPGVKKIEAAAAADTLFIFFDARRTNPAAIHEAITADSAAAV